MKRTHYTIKIICNLILGPTTASALNAGTAPFKDVPVTNTFAGYITYCSQQGIISGYADGTFRPTGTLSGNAFMKMLLGALGYDSAIEGYTGANWTVAVIKQAAGIGLDDGNDEFVGSQAVTRQEAALYAFNMLQATMVEYDAKTSVDINGATVTIAGDKAKEVAQGSYDNNMHKPNLQFAERYFDKLDKTETTDDFARPATKWTFKGDKIGTYAKTPDLTYVGSQKINDIYADLNMSTKDTTANLYVNGVSFDTVKDKDKKDVAATFTVSKANDTKLVCCQVETRQAVENLDGILEVDGVDVYFIGPGDLAASYGEPAGSPKMLELTERMIRRIVAAGKTAGYYVGTPEAARQAEEWGARYLVTAVNQYMVSGGRSFLSQVRGGGAVAASSAY